MGVGLAAAHVSQGDASGTDHGIGSRLRSRRGVVARNQRLIEDRMVVGLKTGSRAVVVEDNLIEAGIACSREVQVGILFALVLTRVRIAIVVTRQRSQNVADAERLHEITVVEEANFILRITGAPVKAKVGQVFEEVDGVGERAALCAHGDVLGLVGATESVCSNNRRAAGVVANDGTVVAQCANGQKVEIFRRGTHNRSALNPGSFSRKEDCGLRRGKGEEAGDQNLFEVHEFIIGAGQFWNQNRRYSNEWKKLVISPKDPWGIKIST